MLTISVILAFADYFLARGFEQDGMFVLCRVTAFAVAERRVGVDDARVTEVLQRHQVLRLTNSVEYKRERQQVAFLSGNLVTLVGL